MDKKLYREFSNNEKTIPIFSKGWWLDAVAGEDNWDAAIVKNGDREIDGALPYIVRKKYCFTLLNMPSLTQTLGPWLRYPKNQKYASRLAFEKDIMTGLIEQLPRFSNFYQNFHYLITNWLPFYWKGFKATTRYTYVLDDIANYEKLWDGLLPKIRTDIKKADDRFNLQAKTDLRIDKFWEVNRLSFKRQGIKFPYSDDLIKKIDMACSKNNARKIFLAVDRLGKIHAAIYIIWDENSAYYLMGGSDPELRTSGATSFLMWEAIKFASTVTRKFDFEGSMIESVERFFRGFGAVQKQYFNVSKTNSRLLKARTLMRKILK